MGVGGGRCITRIFTRYTTHPHPGHPPFWGSNLSILEVEFYFALAHPAPPGAHADIVGGLLLGCPESLRIPEGAPCVLQDRCSCCVCLHVVWGLFGEAYPNVALACVVWPLGRGLKLEVCRIGCPVNGQICASPQLDTLAICQ